MYKEVIRIRYRNTTQRKIRELTFATAAHFTENGTMGQNQLENRQTFTVWANLAPNKTGNARLSAGLSTPGVAQVKLTEVDFDNGLRW